MNMKANFARLNQLFSVFEQKVRPVTKRVRSMLLAQKLGKEPKPAPDQVEKEVREFNERIVPMLNQQLEGRLYFCGQQITGYDLQVFCEVNNIRVLASELVS